METSKKTSMNWNHVVKTVADDVKYIDRLVKGCELIKVRPKYRTYRRVFKLDSDHNAIQYQSTKSCLRCRANASNKNWCRVFLGDVNEVRDGVTSDVFRRAFKKLNVTEDRCFSIVIGDRHKTLDLIAPDAEVRKCWVNGLKHLRKKIQEADLARQHEIWIRELFKFADKNNDKSLSLKEIITLLKHLNIEVNIDSARLIFEEADTDGAKSKRSKQSLDITEFVRFYQLITKREEIIELFEKYNYEGKYLDSEELSDFMSQEQSQRLSRAECAELIKIHEVCPNVKAMNMMSINGLYALFESPLMDVVNMRHGEVYQDMTQPLSHYFIDSSHNTYLKLDQIFGPSEVESYIRALKSGCRCVELDCWDGDTEPVVYHGHTFTSKILFKDIITAVSMYAFSASEFPVILSIENHCSVPQQRMMANYLTSILNGMLYTTPMPESAECLPSPEHLKKKIVIKAKRLPRDVVDGDDGGDVSDEDEAADVDNEEVKKSLALKSRERKHRLAKELSDLVVICQSVSFKNFKHSRNNRNYKQMSSFGENKSEGLCDDQSGAWLEHNTWQLSRVYPSGRRTDSSNYSAMPMWLCGCQIVALNYQTPDEPLQMYKGMFTNNGGCGYVLKPDFMRNTDQKFNPAGPFPPEWKKTLKLIIISGHQLPKKKGDKAKNILDPFVKVEIYGVAADAKSVRTEHIHNNGFHPVWNHQMEAEINVPQMALVRFCVMDYENITSDVIVAQNCVPFASMQNGYRTVHLKSRYGEMVRGASLLVHVNIT